MGIDQDTENRWTAEDRLARPADIDGSPEEVEAIILSQLPATVDAFAEYIDGVTRQLANTERQRILLGNVAIPAEELAAQYLESDRAAALARLTGAAKALCSVAGELNPPA